MLNILGIIMKIMEGSRLWTKKWITQLPTPLALFILANKKRESRCFSKTLDSRLLFCVEFLSNGIFLYNPD